MMTQNKYILSVIICAHTEERWQSLVEAVASVQRQTRQPEETVVVIDHNVPLFERAQQHLQNVLVIENIEQEGLSGARNSGIAQSKGDILAFLDDDAIADENWLEYLSIPFDDERVLGSGGMIAPRWDHAIPLWLPTEFYWVVGCTYQGLPQAAMTVRNLIGTNMMLRRRVFEHVGGFRSSIGRVGNRPMGCEETELCIRANQYWPQGIFLYCPMACVQHHISQKRTTWGYFFARCYDEGISKAIVTDYVGVKDGLASERIYIFKVLPKGFLRGCVDLISKKDFSGIARSAAIFVGLTITTAGYLIGILQRGSIVQKSLPLS